MAGNRGRIVGRRKGMRRHLMILALVAVVATGCGTDTSTLVAPTTPGPTTPVDVEPDDTVPIDQGLHPQDSAADIPPSIAEPILRPTPAPAPAPPAKPVRGLPTPPPTRGLPAPPDPPTRPSDPPPGEVIDDAVADLATRLGIDGASIDLLDAREVTWRDGSVGCPQPGLAYTQALVPGSLVMLRVDDASYAYHAAEGGPILYCPTPQAPLDGTA